MAQFQAYNVILVSADEGIKNVQAGDMTIGYEFYGQYPSYRGTFLSCIENLEIYLDGERVPDDTVYFHINGKQALLSQLKDLYLEYWYVLDKARYFVLKEGGLEGDEHEITIKMRHRIPYTGYHGDYLILDSVDTKVLKMGGNPNPEPKQIPPMTTKVNMADSEAKLCLTLYAMSTEFIHGIMTIEDCLKRGREMGYTGVELVASQFIPEYPHPSKEWMDEFVALLKKYDMRPVCYSAYIDMGTHSDRDLTEEEIIQSTINDMMYAKYMGFDLVRTQHAISPAIYKKMLPYAKKIGIVLAIEMHAPHTPEVDVWKEYLQIMDESEGWLGVVPDFSIFAETPHVLNRVQAVDDFGCRPEMVEEICARHKACEPEEVLMADEKYTDGERFFIQDAYHTYGPAHLEWVDLLMKNTVYIHAKFWVLDEDEFDYTTPCDKLLPLIKASGFNGYIATEYEGHHYTTEIDTCQQLTRYANMLKRYWK